MAHVICILGMHRSGTSAISRIVSLLGVQLGPPGALLEPQLDNPKGYWEHSRIVQINDEILSRFGGMWNVPPAFVEGWAQGPMVADLREEARRMLATEFAGEPLWGWKDPRTCLTLPFWREVAGPMRYIIVVRNPAEVLASLAHRDGMSAETAEGLWLAYTHAALSHTTGQPPRMVVFFEDVLDDLPGELARMAAFTGSPCDLDDPEVLQSVRDFIEPDMWHHHVSTQALVDQRTVSFAAKSLYLAIRREATLERRQIDDTPGPAPSTDNLELLAAGALRAWTEAAAERKAVEAQAAMHAATLASLGAERDQLAAECVRLAAACDGLETERAHLKADVLALTDRNRKLGAARDEVAAREIDARRELADAEARLRLVSAEREDVSRMHQRAARTLDEIEASFAWTLVGAARGAIVRVLPARTRRRRLFHRALRAFVPSPARLD